MLTDDERRAVNSAMNISSELAARGVKEEDIPVMTLAVAKLLVYDAVNPILRGGDKQ